MNIANKSVLITGANRGIGRALVDEALRRGAKRVYAAARSPFQHADKRVPPLVLDVTDTAQIARAAGVVEKLDVLINNAGIAIYDDLSHPEVIEQHMAVNVFGTLKVTRAFLPQLVRAMKEEDRRAIYRFLKSLGATGEPAPAFLPPGQKSLKPSKRSVMSAARGLYALWY